MRRTASGPGSSPPSWPDAWCIWRRPTLSSHRDSVEADRAPMDERRYAIYFVPPADSELYRFGAGVLGYDCYSGKDVPQDSGFDADWAELTREPRRYGFHATLKAPFRLLPSAAEADLVAELRRVAALPRTPPAIAPMIHPIGGFIAIVAG